MLSAILLALMPTVTPAGATDRTGIQVDRPWAQMLMPGQNTIAVYATLMSIRGDSLMGVSSPAAAHATLYLTLRKGGHETLYAMNGGLVLAPNQPMPMAPGGTQIRLTGLKLDRLAGQKVTIVLSFARAGTMSVLVPLDSSAAAGPTP